MKTKLAVDGDLPELFEGEIVYYEEIEGDPVNARVVDYEGMARIIDNEFFVVLGAPFGIPPAVQSSKEAGDVGSSKRSHSDDTDLTPKKKSRQ
jgi:hypothetical protein